MPIRDNREPGDIIAKCNIEFFFKPAEFTNVLDGFSTQSSCIYAPKNSPLRGYKK